jgi:hypothetical protein
MRLISHLGVAACAVLAGCSLSTDLPTTVPRGVVGVIASPDPNGAYVTSPVASFFDASNFTLPDSRSVTDSCVTTDYPSPVGNGSGTTFIDAGSPVTVQIGSSTGQLVPDTVGGVVSYVLQGAPMPITPGASVTVSVPGASGGFPATTMTAPTPQIYAFAHVNPTPDGPLDVTWTPAEGVGTAMVFALPYSITPGATQPDRQIYCSVFDTGSAEVPENLTVEWQHANPGTRSLVSYKWRTTFQSSGNAGLLMIGHLNVNYPALP